MALSARNQIKGKILKVTLESNVNRESAEDMKLTKGDSVEVIIKSTEVMLKK
jgi:molybdopterin-binding protein